MRTPILSALLVLCAGCTSISTCVEEGRFHEALATHPDEADERFVAEAMTSRLEGSFGVRALSVAELEALLPWVPPALGEQQALLLLVEYRLDHAEVAETEVYLSGAHVGERFYQVGLSEWGVWDSLCGYRFAALKSKRSSGRRSFAGRGFFDGLQRLAGVAIGTIGDAVWVGSAGVLDLDLGSNARTPFGEIRDAVREQVAESREARAEAEAKSAEERAERRALWAEYRQAEETRKLLATLLRWPRVAEDGTVQQLCVLWDDGPREHDDWFVPFGRTPDLLRWRLTHVFSHRHDPYPFGSERGACSATDVVALELPPGDTLGERVNAMFSRPRPLTEVRWLRGSYP